MKTSVDEVVQDLAAQLGTFQSRLILVFGSSQYDQTALADSLNKTFADIPIIGCSTAGEIVTGSMHKNSVVAMGLGEGVIEDLNIQVVESLTDTIGVEKAFKGFESYFHQDMGTMDISAYVGLILIDGLSGAEERVMDKIGDLTNVTFIGGSAGDDLKFKKTHVYARGAAHTGAAVLVLLKPVKGFDVLKTQSFKCLDKTLTVTRANEANREVLEFNNLPAVQAYAEATGADMDHVDDYFMLNPLGLMAGDEPYVRSPQQIKGDHIVFYCSMLEGMELSLLESEDIVAETKKALAAKVAHMGDVCAIINFHCILRTLELEKKGQTQAYGQIFTDIPTIGFSTYGEEYIGHINQTSTILLLR